MPMGIGSIFDCVLPHDGHSNQLPRGRTARSDAISALLRACKVTNLWKGALGLHHIVPRLTSQTFALPVIVHNFQQHGSPAALQEKMTFAILSCTHILSHYIMCELASSIA